MRIKDAAHLHHSGVAVASPSSTKLANIEIVTPRKEDRLALSVRGWAANDAKGGQKCRIAARRVCDCLSPTPGPVGYQLARVVRP
jgi:hypothetical protein